jgi:hypothetical protein
VKNVYIITSTSQIKINAVKEVFNINVKPIKVTCNNPEQPFGIGKSGSSNALECAFNRISSIPHTVSLDGILYIISIENGIIETDGLYFDIAEVAIFDVKNGEFSSSCYHNHTKVPIDRKYVQLSRNTGSTEFGFNKSCGEFIGKDLNADPKNWMEKVGVARIQQIVNSLLYTKSLLKTNMQIIKNGIRLVKDFPKPGILFQDMFSLFTNHKTLDTIVSKMADVSSGKGITIVTGPELRGCMLGVLVAQKMKLPYIPIRKKGKLPPPVKQAVYEKEYGVDVMEIYTDALKKEK